MFNLEALYKEVVMEHYQHPSGRTPLDNVTCSAHGYNASCGDEYVVNLSVENGVVTGIQVDGHGCAISGAAGSMLSRIAVGKSIDQVEEIINRYREMLQTGKTDQALPGDLPILSGVNNFPVRIKCATLPMTTCLDALHKIEPQRIQNESS